MREHVGDGDEMIGEGDGLSEHFLTDEGEQSDQSPLGDDIPSDRLEPW